MPAVISSNRFVEWLQTPGWDARICCLTAELARTIDECLGNNRPLAERRVEAYRQRMTREWLPAGIFMVFSSDLKLLNGYHRLEALKRLRPGLEVEIEVVKGVDPRAASLYDDPLAVRDAGDRTCIYLESRGRDGTRKAKGIRLSSASRLVIAWLSWERRGITAKVSEGKTYSGDDEAFPVALENECLYTAEAVVTMAGLARVGLPEAVSLAFIFRTGGSAKAYAFLREVKDGAGLALNSPAKLLRDTLLSSHVGGKVVFSKTWKIAILVRAWTHWLKGSKIKVLRWASNEPFPTLPEGQPC